MFIYECKAPKLTSTDVRHDESNDPLSFEVSKLRNGIKDALHTDDSLFYIYPVEDIVSNYSEDDLAIKEVVQLADKKYKQKVEKNPLDLFDSSVIKGGGNKLAVIKNLNLKKTLYRIDELCLVYKKVVLIKPRLSNPIDDKVYALLLDGKDGSKKESSLFPTNAEGLIDFMYCMYNYGMYIVKLALSIATDSNLTKIKNIKMSADTEYKQYIKTIVDKVHELGIEIENN